MIPKVSILTPSYNGEKYIVKALRSALEQTEKNIEVIVVDDGSKDNTVNLIRTIKDDRLKLFVNDRNRSTTYSLNRALREARGEWVGVLDHDDWYLPERIEKLVKAADNAGADMIADDQSFIRDGEDVPFRTLFSVAGDRYNKIERIEALAFVDADKKSVRKSPHFGLTKPLIKREFLTTHDLMFNERIVYVDDFYLYLTCLLKNAKFYIFPETLYYHRVHKAQHSQQNPTRLLKFLRRAVVDILKRESSSMSPAVKSSLAAYIPMLKRDVNYFRLVKLYKKKGLFGFLSTIACHPLFFDIFVQQSPRILHRLVFGYI